MNITEEYYTIYCCGECHTRYSTEDWDFVEDGIAENEAEACCKEKNK